MEIMINNFKTKHIQDTTYCADSVEWCPIFPFKNTFVCGLYHLENNEDDNAEQRKYHRSGGIIVFTVGKEKLEMDHKINCPAVLDLKWCSTKLSENIALAAANAAGEICLYYFEDQKLRFISKCSLKTNCDDFLMLSLDWVKKDTPDMICSSDSSGNVNLIQILHNSLSVLKKWKAHSLEAWIVCFDAFNQNVLYSGGDDARLIVWDSRSEEACQKCYSSKHIAGVTALNSNLYKEYHMVSGSYDETVQFWDTRNMKRPVETVQASGGVWRLKWEPNPRASYILAACIYGGFQIYNTYHYRVVAEYKEHESLAYGADWSWLDKNEIKSLLDCDESFLIATCSFYDHKTCVSVWNEN